MSTKKAGYDRQSLLSFLRDPMGVIMLIIIIAPLGMFIASFITLPHHDPIREEAWAKTQPHLYETREQSRQGTSKSAEKLKEFFSERKGNARTFASEILSYGGKFAFLKGYFSKGSHERYIEECFCRNIFGPEELKAVVESAVTSYVSEIEGLENKLLVDIRADLDGSEFASAGYLPALGSADQFRHEYDAMMVAVLPGINQAVGIDIAMLVGSQVAGNVLQSLATTLAAEMGVSGAILTGSAWSGVLSGGITIAIGLAIDKMIDLGLRQAGYDPEEAVAKKVIEVIERVERTILEGDEKSQDRHWKAQWRMWSWSASTRDSAVAEAQQIEASGGLGIVRQLRRLSEARSNLREEALKKLILTGGAQ